MTTIPFGGEYIPISLDQVAGYISPDDRIPLLLAISLYKAPLPSLGPYELIPSSISPRLAAWFDASTGICIIGLKGTSLTSSLDRADDKVRPKIAYSI